MEQNTFINKLAMIGGKLGTNIYLQSISQGVMSILPIIIVGSFASLFAGLPIEAWQNLIQSSGLSACLSVVVNATTNILGLLFTYGISKSLAAKSGVKAKIIPILAMIMYLVLLPVTATNEGQAYLAFDYLGTKGMIVGILISFIVVKLYKFIIDKNFTIKMPEGTPQYVIDSFLSLIPTFLIVIFAMVIKMLMGLTTYGDAFNFVYSVLQIPLTGLIGGSLLTNLIFTLLTQVNWSLGVHPGYLTGMTAPVLFALDGANQAMYAAKEEVPNIIGMAFSYITTTAVFYPAIAVSILLFAKSKQLKTVGKVAVAPAFFGISEPLIFGVPIVFNPVFIVPWIIGPLLNFVIAYGLTSLGIVSKCAGVTVFNIPMIFTGLMNGSISIAVMEVFLFVLDIVLFLPFVKAMDKTYTKAEMKAGAQHD